MGITKFLRRKYSTGINGATARFSWKKNKTNNTTAILANTEIDVEPQPHIGPRFIAASNADKPAASKKVPGISNLISVFREVLGNTL